VEPSTIVTGRLRLEPLVAADADEMVDVLEDERLHAFTRGRPLPLDELREHFARLVGGRSPDGSASWLNWIVRVEPGRRAIGYVQATVNEPDRSADVAWVVGTSWQGHGFATEGAVAVVDWLIGEGVRTVHAYIHPAHHASAGVATRAGLRATAETVDGEVVWRRTVAP
jgi:RimJ/RimL family protein N-acetyltransferase